MSNIVPTVHVSCTLSIYRAHYSYIVSIAISCPRQISCPLSIYRVHCPYIVSAVHISSPLSIYHTHYPYIVSTVHISCLLSTYRAHYPYIIPTIHISCPLSIYRIHCHIPYPLSIHHSHYPHIASTLNTESTLNVVPTAISCPRQIQLSISNTVSRLSRTQSLGWKHLVHGSVGAPAKIPESRPYSKPYSKQLEGHDGQHVDFYTFYTSLQTHCCKIPLLNIVLHRRLSSRQTYKRR
jgi:hypothetical protein